LHRSPATILHTLRKHDNENPSQAVFPLAAPALGTEEQARVTRAFHRGMSLKAIARRLSCRRSAVYRALMDERLEKLSRRKIRFIDDSLYHQPDAAAAVEEIARQDDLTRASRPEDSRVPRDLPPYLQDLYRTPLLSAARERALFLKFNFHKFQFVTARRRLEPEFARKRDLDEMETCLHQAIETKNAIVQANLRLVVSVARKHLRPTLSLMELISEGNMVLMRAVEGFDLHRGNRFSTYATLALMKGFARSVPQMLAGRPGGAEISMLESLPDRREGIESDRFSDREQVRDLLARLDDRERAVVLAHYGLDDSAIPLTLDEVGQRLGLSKQRVRQIEKSAIAKLRTVAGADAEHEFSESM
jgi:RNA polymerase sigma factor (sigma-70 family)